MKQISTDERSSAGSGERTACGGVGGELRTVAGGAIGTTRNGLQGVNSSYVNIYDRPVHMVVHVEYVHELEFKLTKPDIVFIQSIMTKYNCELLTLYNIVKDR